MNAVTDYALRPRSLPYGGDLFLIDIQRGRERGITGYSAYLDLCTGIKLNSFEDLEKARVMPRDVIRLFAELYESVHDIDLASGGLAERPRQGAVVGPTFACITAKVFQALKFGDRFYYEHGEQAGSFTPDQLQQLRAASLSRIICDNTNIERIQRRVLRLQHIPGNPEVPCDRIPSIDLSHWADNKNN